MKLAMVTTYATPRNMRRELLEAVIAAGHEVVVIAPAVPGMTEAAAALGATFVAWEVDRTGIAPRADVLAGLRLTRILRAERPDVALLYQIKAVLLGPLAARLARVPRVVALVNGLGNVFDTDGFGKSRSARLARLLYAASLRGVTAAVFQNPDDPALLQRLRLMPKRLPWRVVAGSGVDVEALRPVRPRPIRPTFTLISRLIGAKGVRELVAAARLVRGSYPDIRVRVVGPLEVASHPDAIREDELATWVAEGLLEYPGAVTDVQPVLADTTVFVLPSYYREGVPRTNLEALAMGLPIVTTDSVGCRETVEDGVNGFLVPPRDARALAERMERYLRDPALVLVHGAASRALAERRFDVRLVTTEMLEALQLSARTST